MTIGLDATLNRNTGTWAAPVWDEVDLAEEVTQTLGAAEAEVKNRGLAHAEYERGIIQSGINVTLTWEGADTDLEAFRDAFLNRTLLELFVADGDSATSGTQGLRAEFAVLSFEQSQPLEEAQKVSFTLKPKLGATNKPVWHTIA